MSPRGHDVLLFALVWTATVMWIEVRESIHEREMLQRDQIREIRRLHEQLDRIDDDIAEARARLTRQLDDVTDRQRALRETVEGTRDDVDRALWRARERRRRR